MNDLLKTDPDINLHEISMTNLLLYGNKKLNNIIKSRLIKISIDYVISNNNKRLKSTYYFILYFSFSILHQGKHVQSKLYQPNFGPCNALVFFFLIIQRK